MHITGVFCSMHLKFILVCIKIRCLFATHHKRFDTLEVFGTHFAAGVS